MKKVEAVETPAIAEHLIVLMEKEEETIKEFLKDLKDKRDLPFFHQQVVDGLHAKNKTDILLKMTELVLTKNEVSLSEMKTISEWNFKNNAESFLKKITESVKTLGVKERKYLIDDVGENLRLLFIKEEVDKKADIYVSLFKALGNIEDGPVKKNIKKRATAQMVDLVYASSLKTLSEVAPKIVESLELEDVDQFLKVYVNKFPGINHLKDDIVVMIDKRKESEEKKALIYFEIERYLLNKDSLEIGYFAKEFFNKHNTKLTFLRKRRESLDYQSSPLERAAIKVGEDALGLYAKISDCSGDPEMAKKLSVKARELCLNTIRSFPEGIQKSILKSQRKDLEGLPAVDKLRLEQLMIFEGPKAEKKHRAL